MEQVKVTRLTKLKTNILKKMKLKISSHIFMTSTINKQFVTPYAKMNNRYIV